jgi:hypothetical protein
LVIIDKLDPKKPSFIKLSKLPENCFEPVRKGGWPLISTWINHSLVDLAPDTLVPTWRNGRAGGAGIAKRLDRALVAESLLLEVGRYRSWVELPYISITHL